jgi:hypothetical protein
LGGFVVGKNLKGDLAARFFGGDLLNFCEEEFGEAAAAKVGMDGEVVDVEDRLALEGGEGEKAIGEGGRGIIEVTEEAEGTGDFGEFAGEVFADG